MSNGICRSNLIPTKFIDHGSFGNVYEVFDVDRGHAAALKIAREPAFMPSIVREAEVLAMLQNVPGVVRLYDWGKCTLIDGLDKPFIEEQLLSTTIQKYLDLGNVISPSDFVDLVLEMIVPHVYFRRAGVAHNDIKPDNVMLEMDANPRQYRVGGATYTARSLLRPVYVDWGTSVLRDDPRYRDAVANDVLNTFAVLEQVSEAVDGEVPDEIQGLINDIARTDDGSAESLEAAIANNLGPLFPPAYE